MQDKELYQHILGLSSPWTVRERSLGGTLATSTATNAMRQMGSQYQPDAPVLKLRYLAFYPARAQSAEADGARARHRTG